MPSTQTRTKLKSFQFVESASNAESLKACEAEKENLPAALAKISKSMATPKANRVAKDVSNNNKTPKLPTITDCPPPSTPATKRLPLADLVGNIDDSSRHAPPPVASPEEQLIWRGSQAVNTPLPRKNKKRARSSSPAPSQEDSRLDQARKDITTPQADPAMELWSRYTNSKGTPGANKNVAFAHLINESSPRSAAAAGSVNGLRRWASCGVEFPASNVKRRRVHGVFHQEKDTTEDVFAGASSSDGTMPGQPAKPNIASMVQRMRECVSKPQPRIYSQLPSSSSPLPAAGDRQGVSSGSPLQRRAREQDMDTSETMQPGSEPLGVGLDGDDELVQEEDDSNVELVADQPQASPGSSDDFGDDDFDTDLVEALDIVPQHVDQPTYLTSYVTVPTEPVSPPPPEQHVTLPALPQTGSDDEFGIDDEDDFAADLEQVASLYDTRSVESATTGQAAATGNEEFAATEDATPAPSQQDNRAIQRYLIKQVDEGSYTTDRGYQMPEKVLLVEEEKTKLFKAITLRQAWFDTPCTTGSFVHVIGEFTNTGQCIIDDHHNMLILHPDHLISSTVVADSFGCLRRAVLQDRVKATSKANAPMLYGTLLHELFQEAMKVNKWDSVFLSEIIDVLLPRHLETILEINSTCEAIKEHMSSKLPELQAWAKLFVRAEPQNDAVVRELNGRQSIMSINKLLDVEEHVWSPMYGLKGNIDATVQVTMRDDQGERTLTVPFEVKTGKNSSNAAHVAQTALYNLLLSNRYDVDIAYGILYYLETSDISRVPAVRNDIMHMIIKRNELACYVRDRIELPPILKEDFKCQKCYAQESCFLYHNLVEDGKGEMLNKKTKERYDELVQPLQRSHQDFMKKWDILLTKEETDMMKFRRELWTMLSTDREKLGRCFSNVILEPGSAHEEENGQKINRYSYTFIKQRPVPGFSFTESQLIVGEPIVVSDEQGHFALANGYVTNVKKRRITVAVDRRLHNARIKLPGFNSQSNQTFAGIMEVTKEGDTVSKHEADEEPVLYRLDKDEFSNGMAAARNNLIQIMDNSVYKAHDLRALIVDGRAPVFKPVTDALSIPQSSQMSMNSDQRAAVSKVMSAKDYALVLGMPGTGKTTTIAHIIRTLVAKGKSVLLTSYTHTAVDNILLKIRDDKIGILRLGTVKKIHPEVREFATLGVEPKDSVEELERSWMEPPVVATTCLTINHSLFNRRVFDYCIVDEASQITLPVCLGPIRMAQKFILVGDHYQLPPLVQNKEAMEGGLDVSLFKLLCEAHPQAVVSLEHQYRMCADVMLLSNTFIYSGRLKCGTASVASRKLALPKPDGLKTYHQKRYLSRSSAAETCSGSDTAGCWLTQSLSPDQPVVFINTDLISATLETQSGSRITNTLEARLVTQLTVSLLSLGVAADEIGIIAFYRSQLAMLRQSLSSAYTQTQSSELAAPAISGQGCAGVELHTADKFQGRDKEVVIVSCVRSNENGVVGDLLKDRRRVNVALTRARSKLVILGSEKTLSSNELLRDLVTLCRKKNWVIDLQSEMIDSHSFDEGITQTSKTPTRPSHQLTHVDIMVRSPVLSPTPCKKRKALGDLAATSEQVNARSPKRRLGNKSSSGSPEVRRIPGKVFTAGKRGILDGRPILRDIYNGAI
ncbi:Superfamily I DNA and RNA helicase and helicase subunits [Pyrenophora tritici-repentis]|uniref:DNA replication ATP-dependent helicase/nuclease n=1 Tax=Pyrenophora tritici-repentis TaxID=45151 RepID=A0A2W1HT37_9PLEO|nr:Superfamily I DNA and RNA helicase and helicase subunit [Pyrenophora tritici-repentis]KAF7453737.1 Superfamily I DNA and RNA helicase and helicase protein [Pyrenophora tritici-repentis]KAF7576826.1 Superfamily I DNA and RNA helicase and helicase subunit [Pyrenophora tritici-repentis]KAG9387496.1 Superfamily I DNA and RNA helicase and helicase protein [Pyrenophora tritici-repentis]KAI0581189.1 Superfamily I DNA and RNA helicase and helicase subunit [Pyrenophora tritici-repentis]